MMDFFFFLKTMILTVIVVLLLQIEVGQKTVEKHVHDWMEGSLAAGFLTGKKIKQWIFFKRNESAIAAFRALVKKEI